MQSAGNGKDALLWRGTSRYEVLRCIGRGGMGVVYEAYDRERGRRIAIKTLLRFSPSALYLFKQEFRTLANVLHPNLVRLHELVASEADGVFFTMELVSGQDFCTYTRRPEVLAASRLPPATTDGRHLGLTERASGTLPLDTEAESGTLDEGSERTGARRPTSSGFAMRCASSPRGFTRCTPRGRFIATSSRRTSWSEAMGASCSWTSVSRRSCRAWPMSGGLNRIASAPPSTWRPSRPSASR